jgi:hypothetical protein
MIAALKNAPGLMTWPGLEEGKIRFMELGDSLVIFGMPAETAAFWNAYYTKVLGLN